MHQLTHPEQALGFTAGWLQMLGFAVAAGCAVASVRHARRTPSR